MDLDYTQNNTLAKLPLLKQGEYDTCRLRIEQYIQLQDYTLWEIIEEGNSFKPEPRTTTNEEGTSTITIPGAVSAEERMKKKNDHRAQKARFGGNEATKKTQKTPLKQMYENFTTSSTESLDLIFNRLQKIITHRSTNDGNPADICVNAAGFLVNTANTLDSAASLSDATAYAFIASQSKGSQIIHEDLDKFMRMILNS
ncbi:hypothetical protein Tco_1453387 [Tanacetum coccineum]